MPQIGESTLQVEGRARVFELRMAPIGMDDVLVIMRDITERKAAETQIKSLAYRDHVTGIANRQSFREALQVAVNRPGSTPFTVMYIDLDGFKFVNDTLGHAADDQLLRGVAERLTHCIRTHDVIEAPPGAAAARLGGDEFTLLLLDVDTEAVAAIVAERVLRALQKPFELEEAVATVSASIGIAFFPTHATDPALLLKHADDAMYQAKESGKNKWVLYQPGLHESGASLQSTIG